MNPRTLCLLLCAAGLLPAQRTLEYDRSVVSQVRIDARDLGYPPVDVIPSGESAITALAVAPDGAVYGATSGKRSHLFVLEPRHGYVRPLGFLKDVTAVNGALAVAKNGDVYIGGSIGVDNGAEGYSNYSGGHLLRYTPRSRDAARPIRVDAECEVTDLGAAVPHDGVYTLAIDPERGVIYGVTYPSGTFFSFEIGTAKFTTHGLVAERRIPGERFERDKLLGRALAVSRKGVVFASGEAGALFRFDPAAGKLERLNLTAPTVWGREPYNRVDAWTMDRSGTLYGGTSDGYLFRLDPETLRLENLGKPLNQYRIRGLVFARNGKLYGAGGDDDEMARLFSYDPVRGAYDMLGFIDVNRRPYDSWQAYRIGAVAIGRDGTVYLGESERRSRLYLYYPE